MEDNSQGKRAQTTERKGLVMCTEWSVHRGANALSCLAAACCVMRRLHCERLAGRYHLPWSKSAKRATLCGTWARRLSLGELDEACFHLMRHKQAQAAV